MKLHTTRESLNIVVDCVDEQEKARVISVLHSLGEKIQGFKNNQTHLIDEQEILYFESIDKRTFLYTKDEVYETALRLYEIENVMDRRFIRINKSCILNFDKLESIQADLGGRILCTLLNHEKIHVSRRYASEFKKKLGGK